jgi:ABC-type dipeptide/oligopeptide/nickel transport system ATPase component
MIGLVGESGCGKSVTVFSIIRLVQSLGKYYRGDPVYRDRFTENAPERAGQNPR